MKKKVLFCITLLLLLVFMLGMFSSLNLTQAQTQSEEEIYYTAYDGFIGGNSVKDEIYIENYRYKYDSLIVGYNFPNDGFWTGNNHCAPAAGVNIATYFDVRYPNMIEGEEAGLEMRGRYIFPLTQAKMVETQNLMANYMKTSSSGSTTEENTKNGLVKYAKDRGYNITYNYLGKQTNISFAGINAAAERGNPVLIFTNKYNLIRNLRFENNLRKMSVEDIAKSHVMVVWGIKYLEYFIAGLMYRVDALLRVASGNTYASDEYYRINGHSDLVSAYEVIIN